MFEGEPLPEPPAALSKEKATLLKQKVAGVCGGKAKEVVVEIKPDGGMLVHVKATAESDQELLTKRILALPEMASPNVKLDFVLPK